MNHWFREIEELHKTWIFKPVLINEIELQQHKNQRRDATVSCFGECSLTGCSIFCCSSRPGEAVWGEGAGPLRGGHLSLPHHLHGLHHADAAAEARGCLRHHQAAAPPHLAQLQLHEPAAAVRVGGSVHCAGPLCHAWAGRHLPPRVGLLLRQRF